MPILRTVILVSTWGVALLPAAESAPKRHGAAPTAADPRLTVELFAAAPDIVHPIAVDVDSRGRLLVVESHTHFRPARYDGPKTDRIRLLQDADGDGKADRITTFFEGTSATMDLAVHPDGSVYVATRNEILRLRDVDGDGRADESLRIAFLETKGNYPHNGLAGLAFDTGGGLYFGLGENLGAPYRLIGADGTACGGGGEGGSVFWISAEGKKLRRVATGFWNPFGACRDIWGRLFVVDNDPDASPPCRLLQIVEGGDYGYQFRYGRSGRHPFQAWNGELPGTLPQVAGTGEAPCEVVAYESDGLPAEYLGNLLVPAWADHRVERYVVESRGAGTSSLRRPFLQGDRDFHPSGLAVGRDGSLFVSDWGSKSYELHGRGAVWRVRWKNAPPRAPVKDPEQGLTSLDRLTRQNACRTLLQEEGGRKILAASLRHPNLRVRSAALEALLSVDDRSFDLAEFARQEPADGLRPWAVQALAQRGDDTTEFVEERQPAAVRASALGGRARVGLPDLLKLLAADDPYLRHAAIQYLARSPETLAGLAMQTLKDARQRVGLLLAWRAAAGQSHPDNLNAPRTIIERALRDPDPVVRLLATKWVADERLAALRDTVADLLQQPDLDPRSLMALTTALARIDDQPVNEDALAGYLFSRVHDRKIPATLRIQALRGIPSSNARLKPDLLASWLRDDDAAFRVEVLRVVSERGEAHLVASVHALVADVGQPSSVRAQAVATLAQLPGVTVEPFLRLISDPDRIVRAEALRSLVARPLTEQERQRLLMVPADGSTGGLVERLLGKPFTGQRPTPQDTASWRKLLDGPGDPDVGRRLFENRRLTACALCHRIDGRGATVGPDLSLIGRLEKSALLEAILQPSLNVAPSYQAWRIDTVDGRVLHGLLVHTHLDESHYVDAKGQRFKLEAREIAEVSAARESIMPADLLSPLTDQEIRDLIAYLASRR